MSLWWVYVVLDAEGQGFEHADYALSEPPPQSRDFFIGTQTALA